MAAAYTPRQGQFLAYIHAYTRLHRQPPSEAEMAAFFGVSPPSVHQMVLTLERRGLIERTPGQARSLRVLLPPEDLPDLESGQTLPRQEPAVEAKYPHLARWIMGDGWVELGRTDYARSMARALDEGGMVWEGREHYTDLDELLQDLNEGIERWTEENA
jgi:repressor LexA